MLAFRKHLTTTYIILVLLLAVRVSLSIIALIYAGYSITGLIPAWVDWLGRVAPWLNVFFMVVTFPLILVVVFLNRGDLQSFNIDKFFIILFAYTGFAISQSYLGFDWPVGIIIALIVIAVVWKKAQFGDTNLAVWKISILAIGIFLVFSCMAGNLLEIAKIKQTIYLFFF